MIVDFSAAAQTEPLVCDLCIAGAGAAGIALALPFFDRPERVVVLEGGDESYASDSQELYRGTIVGHPYHELDETRIRFLGGSTNHWGGWCRPLEALDFAPRPWIPNGDGWPIGPDDLAPYLAPAHEILGLGPPRYGPEAAALLAKRLPEFDPNLFVHRFWNEGDPAPQLGAIHRDRLAAAGNVTLFLNANLVDIDLSEDTRRTLAFVVKGGDGQRRTVTATNFVLALGGLENPRLLLNANRQIGPGIGNRHDLVGRHFMDHLEATVGRLAAPAPDAIVAAYGRLPLEPEGDVLRSGICLAPERQEEQRILNQAFYIDPLAARQTSTGYVALGRAIEDLKRGALADIGEHLTAIVADFGGMSRGVYDRVRGTEEVSILSVESHSEQTPNPESRVLLGDEVDRLGLRRIALDWRLTPFDKDSLRTAAGLLAQEIGRLGLGRMRIADWLHDESAAWQDMHGGHHHMGTTRMAADERRGVVDPQCRVFGIDNLYIAGSSVFPVGGTANPTLALVQLSLRLADHLKGAA